MFFSDAPVWALTTLPQMICRGSPLPVTVPLMLPVSVARTGAESARSDVTAVPARRTADRMETKGARARSSNIFPPLATVASGCGTDYELEEEAVQPLP